MERGNALYEEIERAAYELYIRRGMSDGADLNDWLLAEKAVFEKNSGSRNANDSLKSARKPRTRKMQKVHSA